MLAQFAQKQYYTTLDANKGFHQIQIAEQDQQKTAFHAHCRLHQFKRMPFGLQNGPPVFQCFMDKVLECYKWLIARVYVDDLIIFSNNFDSPLCGQ